MKNPKYGIFTVWKMASLCGIFEGIKKDPVFWGILSVQNGKSEIRDFYKWYKWRCGVFFSLSIKKASDNDLRRLVKIRHTGFLSEISDFSSADLIDD